MGDALPHHGNATPEKRQIQQLEQELEITRTGHSEQSSGDLLSSERMRFEFIDNLRDEFRVSHMCAMLRVSGIPFYPWREPPPSE